MKVTKEMLKTKAKYFKSGAGMAVVSTHMDLLGITDISTPRQEKNGTIVWRLPIKYSTHNKFIEVASFATGYVRNQNGGYSNYQLNKRVEKEDYHPEYKMEQGCCVKTGKFYKYNTRSCELIPKEVDRLTYLIGYCLKNYYIKKANEVVEGNYIPKWTHEYDLRKQQEKMEEICHIDANHMFVINELQNKLANSVPKWKYNQAIKSGGEANTIIGGQENTINRLERERDLGNYDRIQCLENTIKNLQNKLETISRRSEVTKSIADNG
jgi:hypothetical protein